MATVQLRNINPLGHVDLPLLRREGLEEAEGVGCLNPGEVFDCPAELAGHAPTGTPGDEGFDPGCGLLAQVGNYELVTPTSKGK